ncbi:LysR family transcriptional regulator [Myxococcota bacterium]|nr:LysR family transcriptional regulator [Myxococcota bacterium]
MAAPPLHHSLDQLLVLDAIERTGTFAGAAAELHRVPSAVSHAVKALEDQLGVPLFERLGNRTALTPAGRRLLEPARAVLAEARELERIARQLRDGWEPELQVVVDGVLPWGPIAAALRAFAQGAIPTRVRVDVEYQEGVPDRWLADDADLMLILDFDPEGDPLTCHPLAPLEMVLVAAPGHPLAARPGLRREDLHDAFELVVKDSSPRYGRSPKQPFMGSQHVVYLSDFHAKRLTALAGVGFGWLPLHLVADDLAQGRLVLLDVPGGQRWTYHPQLVHRADRPLGRAARHFVEALLAAAEGEGG